MNLDRATLEFLESFSDDEKKEARRLRDEGGVSQIFGSHVSIQARVEDGPWGCRTRLQLQGNRWVGETDDPSESGRAALCATMLERIARKGELPEAPSEAVEKTLTEVIEERLGRALTGEEDEYLGKVERRFRRFEIEREVFDSDIVRLNPRWPVDTFEPLELWPTPPANLLEFWNYVAYALEKAGFDWPAFLEPVTDREWTRDRMAEWERRREESEWRYRVEVFEKRPIDEGVEAVEFRLRISTRETRLLVRRGRLGSFERLASAEEFVQLQERYANGGLRMDAASEILWTKFLHASGSEENSDGSLPLERIDTCRFLNRLFHQPELRGWILNLDEHPFQLSEEPLRWVCRPDSFGTDDYELQLFTGDGRAVSHTLRLLPGDEALYLSDEWVFPGPEHWERSDTLIDPRATVPRDVVEGEAGIAFLHRIGATLPGGLADRIVEMPFLLVFELSVAPSTSTSGSEHMLMRIRAAAEDGSREEFLGREGWETTKRAEAEGGLIHRYERSLQRRVPGLIAPMQPTFDPNLGCYRCRITRNFPEKYADWVASLPEGIRIEADAALATLEADPVEAQVSFEVVNEEIDWFDLKVVVDVEGHDLTSAEIKALVQARGSFVRMEGGGWLRLRMNLSETQREAVSRIGLDPFDLSGEVHRLHALQLAEPLAKEVFDAKAWERITARAESLTLQVRPEVPAGLDVHLRPYQVEGFHFLAYLATNGFGGILADDMGLGKTIQTLTWLLWVRENAPDPAPPSLVVCPKSVLDVWGEEVKKASPSIRVQVLRQRSELEVDRLGSEVDLLVVNYSQLRTCADELKSISWLSIILDEGQQIKNPDSKAAKSARALEAQNKLVLTGTPIENRLLDVWSLMGFAMPGILGDRKYFREHFDRRKDPHSQTRLSARLRPFLLRRTKGEVALDLPPKVEENVFCEMEGAQRVAYEAELQRIQKILLGLETDESLRKNSFVVLQGLMRLRQICCHPGLIDAKLLGEESAKMSALFYLLDQLHEEGHKVLVFSQFVTMLDLIRDQIQERDRPFSYLTGQTKNRHEVISEFQESKDARTFLLSLKAGGSGLNLTSASYVVLYDPWWNPAVEAQAIDRCHRIGQESKVNAYRLLVRDSVEEKIRKLQEQKSAMMTGVLGEEGFTRNLEIADLKYLFSYGKETEFREEES